MMLAVIDPAIPVIVVALLAAIPATIAAWNSRLSKRELRPNGGSSMYDKLNASMVGMGVTVRATEDALAHRMDLTEDRMRHRLEDAAKKLDAGLAQHDERLRRVEARQRTAEDVGFRVDARTASIESMLADGDEDGSGPP